MQISSLFQLLLASATVVSATSVKYNSRFDDSTISMSANACTGLINKYGWNFQGDVPQFPNIGAAGTCGACYKLIHNGKSIHVMAVDKVTSGMVISSEAMNALNGGLSTIQATTSKVALSNCGV